MRSATIVPERQGLRKKRSKGRQRKTALWSVDEARPDEMMPLEGDVEEQSAQQTAFKSNHKKKKSKQTKEGKSTTLHNDHCMKPKQTRHIKRAPPIWDEP
jgi:hypothetical protein